MNHLAQQLQPGRVSPGRWQDIGTIFSASGKHLSRAKPASEVNRVARFLIPSLGIGDFRHSSTPVCRALRSGRIIDPNSFKRISTGASRSVNRSPVIRVTKSRRAGDLGVMPSISQQGSCTTESRYVGRHTVPYISSQRTLSLIALDLHRPREDSRENLRIQCISRVSGQAVESGKGRTNVFMRGSGASRRSRVFVSASSSPARFSPGED